MAALPHTLNRAAFLWTGLGGRPMTTPPPPIPEKSSTGLEVNLAAALTYLFGFITGIVFLAIEKDSKFVRFHAMQSTITFLGLFVLNMILTVSLVAAIISLLLVPVTFILWLILMFKAYQGEKFKLPYIGDLAEQQINK
jgi:uncharacterized membrane protein